MKNLLALLCLAALLAACSAASQTMAAGPGSVPAENHAAAGAATLVAAGMTPPPASATSLPLLATSVPADAASSPSTAAATQLLGTPGASPKVIKVHPPHLPVAVTAGALPTLRAGWQSYTSQTLKVSVNYPADWTVEEQADGAAFRSPAGDLIRLQAAGPSQSSDLQCDSLVNSYGLTVQACFDAGTATYSAEFTVAANPALGQPVQLSTTAQTGLEVYRSMLDSLHPAQ